MSNVIEKHFTLRRANGEVGSTLLAGDARSEGSLAKGTPLDWNLLPQCTGCANRA